MDRNTGFDVFHEVSPLYKKKGVSGYKPYMEEMETFSSSIRHTGGEDAVSIGEESTFIAKESPDVPNSAFEEKTRRELINTRRALAVFLFLFASAFIIVTILDQYDILDPEDDDDDRKRIVVSDDDDDEFSLPCVECDGGTLITDMAHIGNNLTIGNHLMVDRVWLLNSTSDIYIDLIEALEDDGGGSSNLTCAECIGDTLVVYNNVNITNDLTVDGDTTLNGNVTITNSTAGDMLVVEIPSWFYDDVTFHEDVTVLGDTYLNGSVFIEGNGTSEMVVVDIPAWFYSDVVFHETITVLGDTFLNNSVFIEGNATIDMFVVRVPTWFYEEVTFHNDITVLGDTHLNGSVFIEGNSTEEMVVVSIPTWFYNEVVFHENVTVIGTTELGNTIIDNTTGTEMLIVYPPSWFYGPATFHGPTNMTVLTVDTVNLLNYTTSEYFDLFIFLDNLTMMQNMIKQTIANHTTQIDNIEQFINNLALDNCTVIQICGPEANVGDALAEAASLSPTELNTVGIEFCPGVYVVDNTGGALEVPAFVSMVARVPGSVVITPMTASNAVFDLQGTTTINGLAFSNGNQYIIQTNFDGTVTRVVHCTMIDGAGFFQALPPSLGFAVGYVVFIEDVHLISTSGSSTTFTEFSSYYNGAVNLIDVVYTHVDGVALGTGVSILGSPSQVFMSDISLTNLQTGIFLANSPDDFRATGVYARNIALSVLEYYNTNGSIPIHLNGLDTDDSVVEEYIIHSNGTVPALYQFGDVHFYNCTEGAKSTFADAIYLEVHTDSIERSSVRSLSDMSIGAPEKPQFTFTGTGKTSARNLLIYLQTGNAEPIRVDKLLCRGLPQTLGLSVNSSLYMAVNVNDGITGTPFQHFGALMILDAAASSVTDNAIVSEFWDGTQWREFTAMEYDYNFPHPKRGNELFTDADAIVINYDYRLRTGFVPYNDTGTGSWTAYDPVAFGEDLMWVRFRVKYTLTTSPTFSYVSHTGNSQEFGDFGTMFMHGHSRRKAHYNYLERQSMVPLETSRIAFVVPSEVDTSSPFLLKIPFSSNTTGDFGFNITYSYYAPGDAINVVDFIDISDSKRRTERIDGSYLSSNTYALLYQELQFEFVKTFNGALAPYMIRIEILFDPPIAGLSSVDLLSRHLTYVKHMEGEPLGWV